MDHELYVSNLKPVLLVWQSWSGGICQCFVVVSVWHIDCFWLECRAVRSLAYLFECMLLLPHQLRCVTWCCCRIPDPEASKPDDWDEDAPREILDEEAEKPEGWLDDEPEEIDDPG